ncbi:MAG: bifunctional 4-hydroxy-2-oxoglutarate aldolase/2-dehydro-3-deoxy-phosphogluconate aldolase [Saccharofermentans sp.]|nr:bifunctional 4-hydroxy-2-oxoglutarate aldolase/2-dehydro-3-deoxy-phosphogluconate aldolase [Saccharofermentans sp.]
MDLIAMAHDTGIVPVIVLNDKSEAVPAAKALLKGGINFMEITLRTPCALAAIKAVSEEVPDMIVGAGTVLDKESARKAVEAGAKFIVSPGFSEETVKFCLDEGVSIIPGCVTPTEIMAAIAMGLDTIKFFPADVFGGMKTLKGLASVFRHIKFMPTGGINLSNMAEYVSEPFITAVGGSFVCSSKDLLAKDYQAITDKASQAVNIIRQIKENIR